MICPNTKTGSIEVLRTFNATHISFIASEVVAVGIRHQSPSYKGANERFDIYVWLKGCSEEMWVDTSDTELDALRKRDEFLNAVNVIKTEQKN